MEYYDLHYSLKMICNNFGGPVTFPHQIEIQVFPIHKEKQEVFPSSTAALCFLTNANMLN